MSDTAVSRGGGKLQIDELITYGQGAECRSVIPFPCSSSLQSSSLSSLYSSSTEGDDLSYQRPSSLLETNDKSSTEANVEVDCEDGLNVIGCYNTVFYMDHLTLCMCRNCLLINSLKCPFLVSLSPLSFSDQCSKFMFYSALQKSLNSAPSTASSSNASNRVQFDSGGDIGERPVVSSMAIPPYIRRHVPVVAIDKDVAGSVNLSMSSVRFSKPVEAMCSGSYRRSFTNIHHELPHPSLSILPFASHTDYHYDYCTDCIPNTDCSDGEAYVLRQDDGEDNERCMDVCEQSLDDLTSSIFAPQFMVEAIAEHNQQYNESLKCKLEKGEPVKGFPSVRNEPSADSGYENSIFQFSLYYSGIPETTGRVTREGTPPVCQSLATRSRIDAEVLEDPILDSNSLKVALYERQQLQLCSSLGNTNPEQVIISNAGQYTVSAGDSLVCTRVPYPLYTCLNQQAAV